MSVLLAAEDVVRRHGERTVVAGVSLAITAGEWLSLIGPSGCGKTSLLSLLGLLDWPGAGRIVLDGADPWRGGSGGRARARLRRIGFVFQQHNLFEHLSARDNVALPAWRLGGSRRAALGAADELLARFGLSERAGGRAGSLSVGEAQRVAIARAMINRPAVVLADEPTGSLDSAAAAAVLAALAEVCAAGTALLLVTHDPAVAARAGRTLSMRDGRLVS